MKEVKEVKKMLQKPMLAGLGVLGFTREKVKEAVDRLVERGKLDKKHATPVIDELVRRGREEKKKITKLVEKGISSGLKRTRIVTREDIEALEKRIGKLEKAVKDLGSRK